jgi:hypothetical protein
LRLALLGWGLTLRFALMIVLLGTRLARALLDLRLALLGWELTLRFTLRIVLLGNRLARTTLVAATCLVFRFP